MEELKKQHLEELFKGYTGELLTEWYQEMIEREEQRVMDRTKEFADPTELDTLINKIIISNAKIDFMKKRIADIENARKTPARDVEMPL